MSKELTTVKVVNTTTGVETEYKATGEPKKGTLGNSYSGTINFKGLAKLQAKGFVINDNKDWCALLQRTFELTADELGSRGDKWDTKEDREMNRVFIDGSEFYPDFTPGQVVKQGINSAPAVAIPQSDAVSIPVPPVAPLVVPPVAIPVPPVAVADTAQLIVPPVQELVVPLVETPLSIEDAHIVSKIRGYIGEYTEAQIIKSLILNVKLSNEKAQQLYARAV